MRRRADYSLYFPDGTLGKKQPAIARLEAAYQVISPARQAKPPLLDARRYRGATVINPNGAVIGEVTGVSEDGFELALGGWRDAWGFIDFSAGRHARVPVNALAFGAPENVKLKLVMVPTANLSATARR